MTVAQNLQPTLRDELAAIVASVSGAHRDPAGGPVIVAVPYTIDRDWSGDDAVHFTVILRDPPGEQDYPIEAVNALRDEIYEAVRGRGIVSIPYTTFRLESEQRALDAGGDDDDA